MMPEITHVSETEWGPWMSWAEWRARPVPNSHGRRIHAWKLSDGTVWDASNGLRPEYMWDKPIDGTGWAEAAFSDDVDPAQRGPSPTQFNAAWREKAAAIYRDRVDRINRMPDNG